jgi:exosome complex RNA-binding protein Rrp4
MTTISGITLGKNGEIWVSDAANNSLLKFVIE